MDRVSKMYWCLKKSDKGDIAARIKLQATYSKALSGIREE